MEAGASEGSQKEAQGEESLENDSIAPSTQWTFRPAMQGGKAISIDILFDSLQKPDAVFRVAQN
jgi:hypothetical protein